MTDKIKDSGFYHSRIKDWPEDERPREKLLRFGPSTLTDTELIAILLRAGTGSITAVDLAKSLLIKYRNLQELSERNIGEFKKLKGIGSAKAVTLLAGFELARRIASGSKPEKIQINSPAAIAKRYIPLLEAKKQEEFLVVLLDSANRILSEEVITKGSLNASIVHPREVFKKAIIDSAASMIILHNHPSGNPKPSEMDRKVTEKLVSAGTIIGIEVLDHIIIAGRNFYSFAEQNEL
ncbi:DNA repair protein RadC [candidate division KSB1 bacterium]